MWPIRLLIALIAAGVLASSHYTAYKSGKASTQRDWDRQTLEQAEATVKLVVDARAKEKVLTTKVTKVAQDYENAKKINGALADKLTGSLRELTSELDKRDAQLAATPTLNHGRTAESEILRSCAGALQELGGIADQHKEQVIALQAYIVAIQDIVKSR